MSTTPGHSPCGSYPPSEAEWLAVRDVSVPGAETGACRGSRNWHAANRLWAKHEACTRTLHDRGQSCGGTHVGGEARGSFGWPHMRRRRRAKKLAATACCSLIARRSNRAKTLTSCAAASKVRNRGTRCRFAAGLSRRGGCTSHDRGDNAVPREIRGCGSSPVVSPSGRCSARLAGSWHRNCPMALGYSLYLAVRLRRRLQEECDES